MEFATNAIQLNFFLGINGPITFTNAKNHQAVVAKLPLDHLILETDAPFLTPHPHRGQRNEPSYLTIINQKLSELLNEAPLSVETITTNNAERVFRIK
jgi:TatD DNase family protein